MSLLCKAKNCSCEDSFGGNHLADSDRARAVQSQSGSSSRAGAGALTINDIARLAGVSKKSVSRVLNNERGLSDDTRARIKAIMEREGYAPNRKARALAGSQSFLIAIAYNNPNPSYVLDTLQGVSDLANERGYEVIMHPVKEAGVAARDSLQAFMSRSGCDGLILTPPLSESQVMIGAFEDAAWAYSRISSDDVALSAPQIRFDDRTAALAMASHIAELGHRNIAFLGGPPDSGPTRRRLAGFKDALRLKQIDLQSEWIAYGDFTFATGRSEGRRLLSLKHSPSAIVCANDAMAAGVMHSASELGLKVPDNVSVSGFDDSPLAEQVWPALTSVAQPVHGMARAACEALLDVIGQSGGGEAISREFPFELKLRQSVAALDSQRKRP